jgi:hypothetical protein
MPRISDVFLNCVLYLYPDRTSAQSGARVGGSGFFVGLPLDVEIRPGQVYYSAVIVTNKHVANHGNSVARINTNDGSFDIVELDERSWLFHKDHDLAISPIELSFELQWSLVVWPHDFMLRDGIESLKIGPGDECFVVGRFVNHEGRQRNTPTVRFGPIAQMPNEKIKFDDGSEQESFLVEARSLPGYSGSPVFIYIPAFDGAGVERGNFSWRRGPWLLGVDHCRLRDRIKVMHRKTGKPVDDDWYVEANTGMMGVVPAWYLAEMFALPDMVSFLETERERAEAHKATLLEDRTGTEDVRLRSLPPT